MPKSGSIGSTGFKHPLSCVDSMEASWPQRETQPKAAIDSDLQQVPILHCSKMSDREASLLVAGDHGGEKTVRTRLTFTRASFSPSHYLNPQDGRNQKFPVQLTFTSTHLKTMSTSFQGVFPTVPPAYNRALPRPSDTRPGPKDMDYSGWMGEMGQQYAAHKAVYQQILGMAPVSEENLIAYQSFVEEYVSLRMIHTESELTN